MTATTQPAAPDTTNDREPLLVVDDWKTYFKTAGGLLRAVDGVSLRVDAGSTIGLVGESGSGKTILSRSILGLVRSRRKVEPGGTITYDGVVINKLSPKERRRYWGKDMAMVFQNPMTSLNPVLTIGRQLTEVLTLHLGMSKALARARAVELLESVGIPEPKKRADEFPHQLSGGMRQRVTIAIALSCNPRLLLADEPTTALDVTVQAQILDLLDEQQSARDMTMILVTHDLGVVAGRTDTVAVMYAGKIVEIAPTKTLFTETRHPYAEALMRSIPTMDAPNHTRLFTIPGRPAQLTGEPKGCRFAPRCSYAQEKCLTEQPPLVAPERPDHSFACWFPVGTKPGQEALERNLSAGQTAAGTSMSLMTVLGA
ncbi:ABC transporter ATP-binding protein [Microbispora sp. H11081]|uniref:ABC transporter ATP-binding protein n=1 Tax=Microbispora sp. H11081 TaxID=2729107 RepID=UPI0014757C12|nr:ABC transporter ATP-binding protein [Microbispora sp. H11081]